MAIEIRQLVIRAVVDGGSRSESSSTDRRLAVLSGHEPPGLRDTADAPLETTIEPSTELGAEERQAIVNACVREVLRKLERARER